MNKSVLICDDNVAVHKTLESYLNEDNIKMISAYNGEDAIGIALSGKVDLVVLDIMLPGISGLDVLREIRKSSDIPVILLSAKGSDIDRIVGLEIGADDYIVKPFTPREVAIRIKKRMKTASSPENTGNKIIKFAEISLNLDAYEATVSGNRVPLSPKEIEVLSYLIYNAGKVLSREAILNAVWNYEYLGGTRNVDAHIKRLRQKLPSENVHYSISSVYGIGYKLEEIP